MIKNNRKKILVMFSIIFLGIIINTITMSASIGTVDDINESKYPGFKQQLKTLQATYPNIKVLYTGLNWNTVIYYEHEETHGRNLVYLDSEDGWICQECRKQGKWYDSGLYCASEEAVRYVMDPRNYLNAKDIFQFQRLDTPVGTTSEISIALKMQQANYLSNDLDAVQAFEDAAKQNNLNAYHLLTRVIQEQGRTGTSTLSSGLGYTGNGYQNYGYGYYNLFSIDASRKNTEPTYMIYVHALDRAAIEGWNTRAASIRGGGKFVGDKYINVGQNTLYLQKFSVYNTKGQLYWHQYMQNLLGAQNEARLLYSLYQANGVQNNKEFEFLVPIYENMPIQNSKMPGAQYDGYMTSYPFDKIQANGEKIKGKLVVQEWLNGTQQMEPTVTPIILLKSRNGETIHCTVEYVEPFLYEYSVNINSINPLEEYYIEVQCGNKNNISNHKIVKIEYENQEIGKIGYYYTYMTNSMFNFRYNGYMVSYPFTNIILHENYMEGILVIQDWLDGTTQAEPKVNPRVFLVAEDGTKIECEVGSIEPCLYGFSTSEKYIDKTKKYIIQVESGTNKNISANNKVKVNYSAQVLGKWGIYTVQIKNNKLEFGYDGYMVSYPFNQNIQVNENKINGQLVVQEWLNGTQQMEPITTPKLVIKDEMGNSISETMIQKVMPCLYNYEIDMSELERGRYTIEVQGTNINNISTHQNIVIQYEDKEICEIGTDKIKIEKGKLIKEEKNNKYDGYMVSYPFNQNIQISGNKISGQMVVQEWLNGTIQIEPITAPKLIIKDEIGNIISETIMRKVMPCLYSYEIDITNLQSGKKHIIEVIGTNPDNISTHQNIEIQYNNRVIEERENYKIKIEAGKLLKEEESKQYDGYMVSYPFNQNIRLTENIICGQVVVQEWLNGTKQMEPVTEPKLIIRDEIGNIISETIMKKEIPYLYTYEIDISNMQTGVNYTIEVIGTNSNNISTHQNIVLQYNDTEIGTSKSGKLCINNGKIILNNIEILTKTVEEDELIFE